MVSFKESSVEAEAFRSGSVQERERLGAGAFRSGSVEDQERNGAENSAWEEVGAFQKSLKKSKHTYL